MTLADLAAIRATWAKSTKGPWVSSWRYVRAGSDIVAQLGDVGSTVFDRNSPENDANAAAIASAPTTIPALCDALEQAWAELAPLKAEIDGRRALIDDKTRKGRTWNCRVHPINWWHEVGCPCRTWSDEQLRDAGYGHIMDAATSPERLEAALEVAHDAVMPDDDGMYSDSALAAALSAALRGEK